MTLQKQSYSVHFYRNSETGRVPVREYLDSLSPKEQGKLTGRIRLLRDFEGRLTTDYARCLQEGIWELRSDVQRRLQRITYVIVSGKRIILLHGFTKKGDKTPEQEIDRAIRYLQDFKATNQTIRYEEE